MGSAITATYLDIRALNALPDSIRHLLLRQATEKP